MEKGFLERGGERTQQKRALVILAEDPSQFPVHASKCLQSPVIPATKDLMPSPDH